jgi:hypothetical protein
MCMGMLAPFRGWEFGLLFLFKILSPSSWPYN